MLRGFERKLEPPFPQAEPLRAQEPNAAARTPRSRLAPLYALGWLRTEHNFHWAMPAAVLKSFEPPLQELIGMAGSNAVEHPWFTGPIYSLPYQGGPDGSAAGEGVEF